VNFKMEAPSEKRTLDSFFAPSMKKARPAGLTDDTAAVKSDVNPADHVAVSKGFMYKDSDLRSK